METHLGNEPLLGRVQSVNPLADFELTIIQICRRDDQERRSQARAFSPTSLSDASSLSRTVFSLISCSATSFLRGDRPTCVGNCAETSNIRNGTTEAGNSQTCCCPARSSPHRSSSHRWSDRGLCNHTHNMTRSEHWLITPWPGLCKTVCSLAS